MDYSTALARIQPREVCTRIMPTTQPSSLRQQLLEQPLLMRVKQLLKHRLPSARMQPVLQRRHIGGDVENKGIERLFAQSCAL